MSQKQLKLLFYSKLECENFERKKKYGILKIWVGILLCSKNFLPDFQKYGRSGKGNTNFFVRPYSILSQHLQLIQPSCSLLLCQYFQVYFRHVSSLRILVCSVTHHVPYITKADAIVCSQQKQKCFHYACIFTSHS